MSPEKLQIIWLLFLPVLFASGLNETSMNENSLRNNNISHWGAFSLASATSSKTTNVLPSDFEANPINRYGYLSPHGLKSLCVLEFQLYGNLSKIWTETSNNTDAIASDLRRYLYDYEESSLMALKHKRKYDEDSIKILAWNPILAFRTVWRFSKYLSRWAQPTNYFPKKQREKMQSIKIVIDGKYNPSDGPTSSDLEDALMALLRLTDILDLNVENLTAGAILEISSVGLNAAQCIDIAMFALGKRMHVYSVEFMEVALEKVQKGGDTSVTLAKTKKHLKLACARHDAKFSPANEFSVESFFSKPLREVNDRLKRKRQKEVPLVEAASVARSDPISPYRYGQVCQGVYHQKDADNDLFCWYERKVHPTFSVGPLKLEFLSVSPQVVKFHKIISEELVSELKNRSVLYESLIAKGKGGHGKSSTTRLGAGVNLFHDATPATKIISEIMERITGMRYNRSYPEPVFINSYTPGAFFTCHNDLIDLFGQYLYARVSTLMFYLSDVSVGGGTGFCKNGLVVKPDKGSAILWHNVLSSGERNEKAAHGSCPVVFGEKWVATRWIYMGPQIHLRCDKDQSKELEYLVNGKSMTKSKL